MNLPPDPTAFADKETKGKSFDPRVWLLALGTFAIGTDAYVVSGILPQLARGLGITIGSAGQVVTTYSLVYALSAPVLTVFVGRVNRAHVVVGALIVFCMANALCAVVPNYPLLLASRALAGMSAGLYVPTAYTLAASQAREDRKSAALAVVVLGLTSATALGVSVGTVLGNRFGWHGTFWFVAVISAVATTTLLIGFHGHSDESNIPSPRLGARLAPLKNIRTLVALMPILLLCAGVFCIYSYLGALLAYRNLDAQHIAIVFLVTGIGAVSGNVVGGQLGYRFKSYRLLFVALIICLCDALIFARASMSFISTAAAAFLIFFAGWFCIPVQQVRLLSLVEAQDAQLVMALNNSCIYLGITAGTVVGGVLLHMAITVEDLNRPAALILALAVLTLYMSNRSTGR
jgi:predicted MFS family arabinose efflux permease